MTTTAAKAAIVAKLAEARALVDTLPVDGAAPPVDETLPPPADWAARSANRVFARRLVSADASDANLAARHTGRATDPDCVVWTPDATPTADNPNPPDNYVEPVIDELGMRFDVLQGKAQADWVFRIPPFGANSKYRQQWNLRFNRAFIDTVFRMADGGYPGIKLAIVNVFEQSSTSPKLVVSTMDQHKFPFLYRYNWGTGMTENIEPAIDNVASDFDWQPKQGQAPTCLRSIVNATPQGVAVPGCDTLVADKWITLDFEADTGDVIPGTDGRAWDCEMRLFMTIDGVRKLVVDYGKTTRGYRGRRAESWTGVWLVPYMTGRDATQAFPETPRAWVREIIVDNKRIAPVLPGSLPEPLPPVIDPPTDTLPSFVPAPGTFAEFTLNTPNDIKDTAGNTQFRPSILFNWTGGAFIRDFSAYGGVVYWGGGEHYSINDKGGALALNLSTRKYEARCVPSITTHIQVSDTAGTDTDVWGAYADDGYQQHKHTYNSLSEMPAEWGGGPQGSLVHVGQSGGVLRTKDPEWPTHTHGKSSVYRYDLSQVQNGHSRLTGEQTFDFGSGTAAAVNDSAHCGMDFVRRGWWVYARTGAGWGGCLSFVSADGVIQNRMTPELGAQWGTIYHFEDTDTLCVIANGVHLHKIGSPTWTSIPLSRFIGDATAVAAFNSQWTYLGYCGFKWSTILGAFCAMDHGVNSNIGGLNTIRVWKITPPTLAARLTGNWTVELITLTSADGSEIPIRSGHENGAWGKLVEAPKLRSFVWTQRMDGRGQLLRLPGM